MIRERQKLIERVRSLLRLADPARNPEENERTSARTEAQRLITKHQLTRAEVLGQPRPMPRPMPWPVNIYRGPMCYPMASTATTSTTSNTVGTVFVRVTIG